MSWSPPMKLGELSRVYGLGIKQLYLIAAAGWLKIEGDRVRIDGRSRDEVAALLQAAEAAQRMIASSADGDPDLEPHPQDALLSELWAMWSADPANDP